MLGYRIHFYEGYSTLLLSYEPNWLSQNTQFGLYIAYLYRARSSETYEIYTYNKTVDEENLYVPLLLYHAKTIKLI